MWPRDVPGSTQSGSKRKRPHPDIDVAAMRNDIEYTMDNIPHKDQLALFIPSQFIYLLAVRAGIFSPSVFRSSIPASGQRNTQGFVGHQRYQEQEQRFKCQIS